jgi:hypothetical protein
MNSPKLFRLLVLGGALLGQAGCGAPKDPNPGPGSGQMVTDDGMMQQQPKDGGGAKPDLFGVGGGGDDGGGQPMW